MTDTCQAKGCGSDATREETVELGEYHWEAPFCADHGPTDELAKEHTSVRVSVSAREVAKRSKKVGETWDDYLLRCAETSRRSKWTEDEIREIVRDELGTHHSPVDPGVLPSVSGDDVADEIEDSGLSFEDDDECPECGGELVCSLGSDDRQCPACGWSE